MAQAGTTAELVELIAPFVGARLNRVTDPESKFGAYLPRTEAIDIRQRGLVSYDADVREITGEGVSVFFSHRCELIPWASIHSITLAHTDRYGNRTTERHIAHAGASVRRAA